METAKVFVAQMSPNTGDVPENCHTILSLAKEAREQGADVLLTPELSLCGLCPKDLLFQEEFLNRCAQGLEILCEKSSKYPDLKIVVGLPLKDPHGIKNAVVLISEGKILATYFKKNLSTYLDESRYFKSHNEVCPLTFEVKGIQFALCADSDLSECSFTKDDNNQTLLVLKSFPYEEGSLDLHIQSINQIVSSYEKSVISLSSTGALDGLVMGGLSIASDQDGVKKMLSPFDESTALVAITKQGILGVPESVKSESLGDYYKALVVALKTYVEKNRFKGIVLGLSGGIDSALVLKIAVDAIGARNVLAVMMPSCYTSQMSLDDAKALASNVGVRYEQIPITPAMEVYQSMLMKELSGRPEGTTAENLQARIRGMILMAISNQKGYLVLATGNKSEMAVGYSTLYGDLAGGFAPIKDVYKTRVYELCHWLNQLDPKPVFPQNILDRAPSAELREDQKDQDSLPPYDTLDSILKRYIEAGQSLKDIVDAGFDEAITRKVISMIHFAEFKRQQSPIGTKVSSRSFDQDWHFPISSSYKI